MKRIRLVLFFVLSLGCCAFLFRAAHESSAASSEGGVENPSHITKEVLSHSLGPFLEKNDLPDELNLNIGDDVVHGQLNYAIDAQSQLFISNLMRSYRPDYGAFVAMDATTGRILAMTSYTHDKSDTRNWALVSSFPAASIFKVVTATAALDKNLLTPETVLGFNGANHTLYRRNVQQLKESRWTRYVSLSSAFARSINTIFGRVGLYVVGADTLKDYAERFLFNQAVPADFPVERSIASFDGADDWSVVSAASGFTRDNTLSPIQGALMASAIANDGVLMEPFLVDSVEDTQGNILYEVAQRTHRQVVSSETAKQMRVMMSETVYAGTSRKAFNRTLRQFRNETIELGGKTGSLSGLEPRGKCDWFIGYARYRDQKIAVAALTVNKQQWRVKSAYLASEFLRQRMLKIRNDDRLAAR